MRPVQRSRKDCRVEERRVAVVPHSHVKCNRCSVLYVGLRQTTAVISVWRTYTMIRRTWNIVRQVHEARNISVDSERRLHFVQRILLLYLLFEFFVSN